MPTLPELLAQKAELEVQIAQARNAARAEAVTTVRKIIAEHKLTTQEIEFGSVPPREKRKIAPKYKNPETGATWTGRGVQPRWVRAVLHEGKNLDDFLIPPSDPKT